MNLRFPGQYYDQQTGQHYNYFRDYNPKMGRYIQSDTIGLAGGINTYSYVLQNSIININNLGLNSTLICATPFNAAACAAAGFGVGGKLAKSTSS